MKKFISIALVLIAVLLVETVQAASALGAGRSTRSESAGRVAMEAPVQLRSGPAAIPADLRNPGLYSGPHGVYLPSMIR